MNRNDIKHLKKLLKKLHSIIKALTTTTTIIIIIIIKNCQVGILIINIVA